MELFQAHDQWASRPDDERFESLQKLFEATHAYALTAREMDDFVVSSLRVEAVDGAVMLMSKVAAPAALTHWSFGQLASRAGAPAGYLRTLPPTLAAQNLNYGLGHSDRKLVANLLIHSDGRADVLRSLTTNKYSRVWNYEVAQRLLEMESRGWAPATPDVRIDLDPRGPRLPLYASDHDMFAFIVHSDRVIKEPGNPLGLKRGLIACNSEVGGGALWLMRFLYREMCGNHIIWGAEEVERMRAVHVGRVRDKFAGWSVDVTKYLDESAADDEARIAAMQSKRIGATREEVIDMLFDADLGFTRTVLECGWNEVKEGDGDPLTAWGIAQGLTRYSQMQSRYYADERMRIDRAVGRMLAEVL